MQMTIDQQIAFIESLSVDLGDERALAEVLITLKDCQRLVTEKDRDIRGHLFHFLKQRLTGKELPAEVKRGAEVQLNLTTGQWLEYYGRTLQFISLHGVDLLAMDKSGKEVSIPKNQWKNIKILNQSAHQ